MSPASWPVIMVSSRVPHTMDVTLESEISHLSIGAWEEMDSSTVLVSITNTWNMVIIELINL